MTIMSFGYQGTKSGCYTISSLNHEAHGSFWGSGTIKRSKMPCWTFRSMLDYLKSGQSKTMLHSVIFLWQYNVILPLFSSFRTEIILVRNSKFFMNQKHEVVSLRHTVISQHFPTSLWSEQISTKYMGAQRNIRTVFASSGYCYNMISQNIECPRVPQKNRSRQNEQKFLKVELALVI